MEKFEKMLLEDPTPFDSFDPVYKGAVVKGRESLIAALNSIALPSERVRFLETIFYQEAIPRSTVEDNLILNDAAFINKDAIRIQDWGGFQDFVFLQLIKEAQFDEYPTFPSSYSATIEESQWPNGYDWQKIVEFAEFAKANDSRYYIRYLQYLKREVGLNPLSQRDTAYSSNRRYNDRALEPEEMLRRLNILLPYNDAPTSIDESENYQSDLLKRGSKENSAHLMHPLFGNAWIGERLRGIDEQIAGLSIYEIRDDLIWLSSPHYDFAGYVGKLIECLRLDHGLFYKKVLPNLRSSSGETMTRKVFQNYVSHTKEFEKGMSEGVRAVVRTITKRI